VWVCCVEGLLGDHIWCVWHRVWVFVRLCVCVSACVWVRESQRESVCVCCVEGLLGDHIWCVWHRVCVCVCVCERERVKERTYVGVVLRDSWVLTSSL